MARLALTPRAREQLRAAFRYLAKDSPRYANAWRTQMRAALRSLIYQPLRGYPAPYIPNQDLRTLIQGRYKIIYKFDPDIDMIEVLMILHEAQLPPAEVL